MNEETWKKEEKKAWEELCRVAEKYSVFMHPHRAIIIDAMGIEIVDGVRAERFKERSD